MTSIMLFLASIVSAVTADVDIQQQYAIQIAAALSGCRGEHVAADFTPYDQRALKPRPIAQPRSQAEALCLAEAMRSVDRSAHQ